MHGNIRALWQRLRWERGWLGYPVTDEISRFGDRYRTSTFEFGTLYWSTERPEPFTMPRDHAALLIVAHESFLTDLAPLVAHKRATGVPTLLIDPTSLAAYSGRDDAERVKRAIFEAHHDLGLPYVLLVGDASRVPVRYRRTAVTDKWTNAWYTAADHYYYANLYLHHDAAGHPDRRSGFSDWDADGDGAYNEQNWADDLLRHNPDRVDAYPDVSVGRVPAHGREQVRTFVAKVLRYETGTARAARPKTSVLVDAG